MRAIKDQAAATARRAHARAARAVRRARRAGGATAPRLERLAYGARREAWAADTYSYTY